uniref:Nudix hydrolase domain-containing protein n=1 Tax=Medicago truncatula TaxID=3880 RepID=B7FMS5_MEDTR|nr:unknown [Medicago truncatula]
MFMSVITSSSQQTHQFLLITSLLFLINKIKKTNKRIVMGLLLSRSLACKFFYPLLFSKKVHNDFFPQQLENMMCLVSPGTGSHLQRYEQGCRQVVGCIPYRYKKNGTQEKEIEVLLISAQKGSGMQFPKGGWEKDETMEQAALRETIEEAGVIGSVESNLGKWYYKSKRQPTMHEGYMFPLLVSKELDNWPEMNIRRRKWLTVDEAKEICPYAWMKKLWMNWLVDKPIQSKF